MPPSTHSSLPCDQCEYVEVQYRCGHRMLQVANKDTSTCTSLKQDGFRRHYCTKDLHPTIQTVKMSSEFSTRNEATLCLRADCFKAFVENVSDTFKQQMDRYHEIRKELYSTPGLRDIVIGLSNQHKSILKQSFFVQDYFNSEGKPIPQYGCEIERFEEFVHEGRGKVIVLTDLLSKRSTTNFNHEPLVDHKWLTPRSDLLLLLKTDELHRFIKESLRPLIGIKAVFDQIDVAYEAFKAKKEDLESVGTEFYETYPVSTSRWEAAKLWGDGMISDGFGDETQEERMQREFGHLWPSEHEGPVGAAAFYTEARDLQQPPEDIETPVPSDQSYFDEIGAFNSLQ